MLQPKSLQKRANNLGKFAEDFAVKFLQDKDYKILERNFHSRFGEIDIIAIDHDTLVFVEVKARWSVKFGAPVEAVDYWKLRKIQKTASYYRLLHNNLPEKERIDVVALEIENGKIISTNLVHED